MLREKFDHFLWSPDQMIATCQRNIVGSNMLRPFGHPVVKCCDMMRGVVCCWLKFENGQIFHVTFLVDAWCFAWCRLAKFVQQRCARACTLVRFSIPSILQHVTTGWPNARNILRPTMLRYVACDCCDRLAGACKCWANNVGICCVQMLRSFGRGFKFEPRTPNMSQHVATG